jgi:hypothetical protein
VSSVVTEVKAGQLDPSWLGQLFEADEETRDGPVRCGFRLRGYTIPLDGGGKVRLATETSTIAVDPEAVLRCYALAAAPDRWTGVLPYGAPGPGAGYVQPPASPVAAPAGVAQGPGGQPVPVQYQQMPPQPGPVGPPVPFQAPPAPRQYPQHAPQHAPQQPTAAPAPVRPAGPPPWQQPGGQGGQDGWGQPGGGR